MRGVVQVPKVPRCQTCPAAASYTVRTSMTPTRSFCWGCVPRELDRVRQYIDQGAHFSLRKLSAQRRVEDK